MNNVDKAHTSRKRLFRWLAAGCGVLVFLALDLIVGSLVGYRTQGSFRASHPYYHHGLLPYQQRMTSWGNRDYRMSTNSLAFRDESVREVPLQSDQYRVVLIGDSMIEGMGVEFEKSVAGWLQDRWAANGIEFLNAASVSYSPHLYHLRTRYLVEEVGLQFDQLVVFIDISDIQDEVFYEEFRPQDAPVSSGPDLGWWRRNSLTANLIARIATKDRQIDNSFRADADIDIWMKGTRAYHADDVEDGRFEWTLDPEIYDQWGEKGLLLAKDHMQRLAGLCRDHGIELTVVVYPSPVQIYAADLDSRQVQFWRNFCAESDSHFVDLFPLFINYDYSGPTEVYRRFFIYDDVHWNEAGHLLVAERLADELDVPDSQ